jgi:DNA-binding response OmpR family regulator
MHDENAAMMRRGEILLADDEETFRESTADLLRQEGYACTCVSTAEDVFVLVNSREFDLLIVDIRMPGNEQLELLERMKEFRERIPVMVVTAYPTTETAIDAIHASVFDYFTKPIEFLDFLPKVEQAIAWSSTRRVARGLRLRLSNWHDEIVALENDLAHRRSRDVLVTLNDLAKLAHGHLAGAVREVRYAGGTTDDRWRVEVCKAMGCNRLSLLLQAIRDTVMVLEKTKTSFKSKEIRDLRKSLQQILVSYDTESTRTWE